MYPEPLGKIFSRYVSYNLLFSPQLLTVKYGAIGTEGEGIKLRGGYGFEVQAVCGLGSLHVNAGVLTQKTEGTHTGVVLSFVVFLLL